MNRFVLLIAILLLGLNACRQNQASGGEENKRPNILFIMSDDHASSAVSAYGGPVSKVARTPNIDRLAEEEPVVADDQQRVVTPSVLSRRSISN